MKILIEVILGAIIIQLVSKFIEKKKLLKFGVTNMAQLKVKIDAKFRNEFNGVVTTKDIINFAFTLPDVIDVAVYEDVFIQAIFVKLKKASPVKPKQVINTITEFIQSSSVVYPRKYRIDVNGRENLAKRKGNVVNIIDYATSQGLTDTYIQQADEDTKKDLKIIAIPVILLAILLISDYFSGSQTASDSVPPPISSRQEEKSKQNSDQKEVRKIYVEAETAKIDTETGKWIICSSEEKPTSANEIRIRPGEEKYIPELNIQVIGGEPSTTTVSADNNKRATIIGSTKEQIIAAFKDWRRDYEFEKIALNSLQFENDNLIVSVDFNNNGIAEGVSFLTQNIEWEDMATGENSYVNQNYDELVNWATGGKETKIEKNKTTKYPVDIFIGNVHDE